MINLKKYTTHVQRFVLFLTITSFIACSSTGLRNTNIEAKKNAITSDLPEEQKIEDFIAPYRTHINKDLDYVLAYAPETFDKSKGKWQTNIGNLLADATFEKADKIFYTREGKHVNVCLLNHGGIRAIIPKGDVTTKTAYDIMPFENSTVVIALKGEQLKEMADYIAVERKPHPLSGMLITLDTNGLVKNVTVQGKPLDLSQTYYVATSDYLSGGGDRMNFFLTNTGSYSLDYKLRNLFIDYFKETDTLPVSTTQRIITE